MSKEIIKKVSKAGLVVAVGCAGMPFSSIIEATTEGIVQTDEQQYELTMKLTGAAELLNHIDNNTGFILKNSDGIVLNYKVTDYDEATNTFRITTSGVLTDGKIFLNIKEKDNENYITDRQFELHKDSALQELTLAESKEDLNINIENGSIKVKLDDTVKSSIKEITCSYKDKSLPSTYDESKKFYSFEPGLEGDYIVKATLENESVITKTVAVKAEDIKSKAADFSIQHDGKEMEWTDNVVISDKSTCKISLKPYVWKDENITLQLLDKKNNVIGNGLENVIHTDGSYNITLQLNSSLSDEVYKIKLTGKNLNEEEQSVVSNQLILDKTAPVLEESGAVESGSLVYTLTEANLSLEDSKIWIEKDGKELDGKSLSEAGIVVTQFTKEENNYKAEAKFTKSLSGGIYTVHVQATDKTGKQATMKKEFEVESIAPDIQFAIPETSFAKNDGKPHTECVNITEENFDADNTSITIYKDESEVALTAEELNKNGITIESFIEKTDMKNNVMSANIIFSDTASEGTYTITVTSTDTHQNKAEASKTVIVDRTTAGLSIDTDIKGNTSEKEGITNILSSITFSVDEKNFFEDEAVIRINGDEKESSWNREEGTDTYRAILENLEEGKYKFTLDYTDRAGNKAEQKVKEIIYDKTPVQVDLKESGKEWKDDGKWRTKAAAFTYTLEDQYAGIEQITYRMKEVNGEVKDYKITFSDGNMQINGSDVSHVFNDNGRSIRGYIENGKWIITIEFTESVDAILSYTCTDKANNLSEGELHLKQDLKQPEFKDFESLFEQYNMDDSSWVNNAYTVTVNTKDDFSKVERVEYQWDHETQWKQAVMDEENLNQYNIVNDVPNGKMYNGSLYMRVTDYAGNVSDTKEIHINSDKIAPVIDIQHTGNARNDTYYKEAVKDIVKISEHSFDSAVINFYKNGTLLSGQNVVKEGIKVDDEWNKIQDEKNPQLFHYTKNIQFPSDNDGAYTYEVIAQDKAQNTTKKSSQTYILDYTDLNAAISFEQKQNDKFTDNNYFLQDAVTVHFDVEEHNFDKDLMEISVMKDGKAYEDYSLLAWTSAGDHHRLDLTFAKEGHYTVTLHGSDLSGRKLKTQSKTFVIDHTLPEIEKITFKEKNSNAAASLANAISLGRFFQKEVEVKLYAKDTVSGVDQIYFYYDGVDYNNHKDTIEGNNQVFTSDHLEKVKGAVKSVNGKEMTVTFPIKPNFKGRVYAAVQDKAGNIDMQKDSPVYVSSPYGIVVEDDTQLHTKIKANIAIDTKPNNTLKDGTMLFQKDVPVQFEIEAPYSGIRQVTYKLGDMDPVVIKSFEPGKSGICEKTLIKDIVKSKAGGLNDKNDVMINVEVVDNAGQKRTFHKKIAIDRTAPLLSYDFDYNKVSNGHYYNKHRRLTLHIRELNFEPEKVHIKVKENGTISSKTPKASSWKSDGIDHTAVVVFDNDADYKIEMDYTDRAGNRGNTLNLDDFTIDTKAPKATVSYDNNGSRNGKYFNNTRTATIKVVEHNFNSAKFKAALTAQNDGKQATAPSLSSWTKNGDTHTATIRFYNDADYSMQLSYTDEAENIMNTPSKESFTVDKKIPEVSIDSVKNLSSNRKPVAPSISYSDINLDKKNSGIQVEGTDNGKVKIKAAEKQEKHSISYAMEPLKLDDNYVVSANALDMAGNKTNKSISFSVNQNGSIFVLQQKLTNKKYVNSPFRPAITIKNVDEVSIMSLTLNGVSVPYTLENGVLTIDKEIDQNGKYIINLQVRDAAGNVNRMSPIEFIYDDEKPIPVFLINKDKMKEIYFGPITLTMKCEKEADHVTAVYLNNEVLGKNQYEMNADGSVTLKVSDYGEYDVRFEMMDDAGNKAVSDVYHFTLSNNLLLRYFDNKPLFYGSIGVIGIGVIGALTLRFRKKKA